MVELVAKQERHVLAHRRFYAFLNIHPFFVFLDMARLVAVNTRQQSFIAVVVNRFGLVIYNFVFVFSFYVTRFGFLLVYRIGVKLRAIKQRTVAVLFTF